MPLTRDYVVIDADSRLVVVVGRRRPVGLRRVHTRSHRGAYRTTRTAAPARRAVHRRHLNATGPTTAPPGMPHRQRFAVLPGGELLASSRPQDGNARPSISCPTPHNRARTSRPAAFSTTSPSAAHLRPHAGAANDATASKTTEPSPPSRRRPRHGRSATTSSPRQEEKHERLQAPRRHGQPRHQQTPAPRQLLPGHPDWPERHQGVRQNSEEQPGPVKGRFPHATPTSACRGGRGPHGAVR